MSSLTGNGYLINIVDTYEMPTQLVLAFVDTLSKNYLCLYKCTSQRVLIYDVPHLLFFILYLTFVFMLTQLCPFSPSLYPNDYSCCAAHERFSENAFLPFKVIHCPVLPTRLFFIFLHMLLGRYNVS